jgi:hypothetical protein
MEGAFRRYAVADNGFLPPDLPPRAAKYKVGRAARGGPDGRAWPFLPKNGDNPCGRPDARDTTTYYLHRRRRQETTMVIVGDTRYIPEDEFKAKIQKALDLLSSKDACNSAVLTSYVGRIRAAAKSGADVRANPMTIDIAKPTFDASLTWLASVLVHESYHCVQHKKKKKYWGQDAEKECNEYQLQSLRAIGAPDYEIAYQMAQDGNHFDRNGDGKYDEKDYELRDY